MKRTEPSPEHPTPRASPAAEAMATAGEAAPFAVDWAQRENAVDEVLAELTQRASRRRRRRTAAVVAGVALFVGAGLWWYPRPADVSVGVPASQTVAAAFARQVLPDGSTVELKEGAAITVNFTATRRQVTQHRGVAHFTVAKDERKPFVVQAGRIEVRAVGTEFSVNLEPTSAEVLVTEGKVAIDQTADASGAVAKSAPPTLAYVGSGNRVVIDLTTPTLAAPAPEAVDATTIAERLAWRVPRLEFSATPLAEAIGMFNRHNPVQLTLADTALGDLKISGYLRADKTETFLRLLETEFGLEAERPAPARIVLRRPREKTEATP